MSKIVRNIQTQQVDEKCSVCKKGFMRPTGIMESTIPPIYHHKCTVCNHTQNYTIRYPHIVQ